MFSLLLRYIIVAVLMTILFLTGCSQDAQNQDDMESGEFITDEAGENLNSETGEDLALPPVELEDGTLAEIIYQRRSHRNYKDRALDLSEIGNLLWSAGGLGIDGITGPTRVYPSAGGAHPLDFYLVAGEVSGLSAGVYRYDHTEHKLIPVIPGDFRDRLAEAALGQGFIANAPASIILVAYYERTKSRYGERGERYVHMDAGYASQNIYLVATEMGLGTVAVGAFDDSALADVIQTEGAPLMVMPVGDVKQ